MVFMTLSTVSRQYPQESHCRLHRTVLSNHSFGNSVLSRILPGNSVEYDGSVRSIILPANRSLAYAATTILGR